MSVAFLSQLSNHSPVDSVQSATATGHHIGLTGSNNNRNSTAAEVLFSTLRHRRMDSNANPVDHHHGAPPHQLSTSAILELLSTSTNNNHQQLVNNGNVGERTTSEHKGHRSLWLGQLEHNNNNGNKMENSTGPVDLTIATTLNGFQPHHQRSMSTGSSGSLTSTQSIAMSTSLPTTPSPTGLTNTIGGASASSVFNTRKQREFIPDNKKDESYWDRRRRNNEAAKRSREKRRISDLVLEQRVLELSRENALLRAELYSLKEKFGLPPNQHFVDPDSISLPVPEGINCRGRRSKLLSAVLPASPVLTSVLGVNGSIGGAVGGGSGQSSGSGERSGHQLSSSLSTSSTSSNGSTTLSNYISASSPLSSSSSLSDHSTSTPTNSVPVIGDGRRDLEAELLAFHHHRQQQQRSKGTNGNGRIRKDCRDHHSFVVVDDNNLVESRGSLMSMMSMEEDHHEEEEPLDIEEEDEIVVGGRKTSTSDEEGRGMGHLQRQLQLKLQRRKFGVQEASLPQDGMRRNSITSTNSTSTGYRLETIRSATMSNVGGTTVGTVTTSLLPHKLRHKVVSTVSPPSTTTLTMESLPSGRGSSSSSPPNGSPSKEERSGNGNTIVTPMEHDDVGGEEEDGVSQNNNDNVKNREEEVAQG